MRLNEISDNHGATKNRKRLGRGIGSGTGKTAGRGHKGQHARSGVAVNGFEGGQMPIHRRLPKRGFSNISRKDYAEINLGQIQTAIDAGKLDAKNVIGTDALIASGLVRRKKDGIRLLGKGELTTKINLQISGASKTATDAIEKLGGKIEHPGREPRKDKTEKTAAKTKPVKAETKEPKAKVPAKDAKPKADKKAKPE